MPQKRGPLRKTKEKKEGRRRKKEERSRKEKERRKKQEVRRKKTKTRRKTKEAGKERSKKSRAKHYTPPPSDRPPLAAIMLIFTCKNTNVYQSHRMGLTAIWDVQHPLGCLNPLKRGVAPPGVGRLLSFVALFPD